MTDAEKGTAAVAAGDESFVFQVERQFGTGFIRAAGSNADGTPAVVTMGMPVNNSGKPAFDHSQVGVHAEVGKDPRVGPSLYKYPVGDTAGSTLSYSDDGSHAEGTVPFEYADNDDAKDGHTCGDLVDGTFTATCPRP